MTRTGRWPSATFGVLAVSLNAYPALADDIAPTPAAPTTQPAPAPRSVVEVSFEGPNEHLDIGVRPVRKAKRVIELMNMGDLPGASCRTPCTLSLPPGHYEFHAYGETSLVTEKTTITVAGPLVVRTTMGSNTGRTVGLGLLVLGVLLGVTGLAVPIAYGGCGSEDNAGAQHCDREIGRVVTVANVLLASGAASAVGGGVVLMVSQPSTEVTPVSSRAPEPTPPRRAQVGSGLRLRVSF